MTGYTELCRKPSGSGSWTCSLEKGHEGTVHVAQSGHQRKGAVLEVWSVEVVAEERAVPLWKAEPTY